MKQTAVEWLAEKVNSKNFIKYDDFFKLIELVKEMEKEQIVDAYQSGIIDGQIFALTRKIDIETGEQYYNEKFNK